MMKHLQAVQYSTLILVVFFTGCAQNEAYHTVKYEPGNCISNAKSDSCVESYYQEYEKFDLAFAEFSERGNAFSDKDIDVVLQRIKSRAKEDGVVLVTFTPAFQNQRSNLSSSGIQFI